jgi:NAD(P)-dependent dehydrogenase (short-subunit alcohol dehydrogenase family)
LTALILGASSGFGAACCRSFAAAGYDIVGVHLDRRSAMPGVDALVSELRGTGRTVDFHNANAADDDQRAGVVAACGPVHVLVHSLAFGSLAPYVGDRVVSRKQLEMTVDVMGHSLVYWCQDLFAARKLGKGGRVFAMTSSGSHMVWKAYGPVSAAKCVLEAHVRQLAVELAPHGVTVNAILAGVTRTPALARIPGSDELIAQAERRNPHGRLTMPDDVAACLVELARPGTAWLTGNVLRVDGGEDIAG